MGMLQKPLTAIRTHNSGVLPALPEPVPRFHSDQEREAFRKHCKFEQRKIATQKKQLKRESWITRCEEYPKTMPKFEHLADQLGAGSKPARMGLANACLSLPSKHLLEIGLKGKSVLDLCSGSALPDATYFDESDLERFSPWFSRLCHHLGAKVIALDIRPQAPWEKFESLIADSSKLPILRQKLLALGAFDLICANGLQDPYNFEPAYKEESRAYKRELHLILRTKLKGPGSVLIFNREQTIAGNG
jgi:hypothetical protein